MLALSFMMGVVTHAQSFQNRKLVIFFQFFIATAFVFCCDAKHSYILRGSSYVGKNWKHNENHIVNEIFKIQSDFVTMRHQQKLDIFFSSWMKFLLPFVIFEWHLLSKNNKYLNDYTKRRCTKYKPLLKSSDNSA